jgi:hypothetical protein
MARALNMLKYKTRQPISLAPAKEILDEYTKNNGSWVV